MVGGDVCHTRCHRHKPWGQQGQTGAAQEYPAGLQAASGQPWDTGVKGTPQSTPGGCNGPPTSASPQNNWDQGEPSPHQEHPRVVPALGQGGWRGKQPKVLPPPLQAACPQSQGTHRLGGHPRVSPYLCWGRVELLPSIPAGRRRMSSTAAGLPFGSAPSHYGPTALWGHTGLRTPQPHHTPSTPQQSLCPPLPRPSHHSPLLG